MKPESKIQIQIINLLSVYSRKNKFTFFAVLNEAALMDLNGKRKDSIINYLKKMGMTPGVSDIIIVKEGLIYCLELKSETGRQTKNQEIFEFNIKNAGGRYELAYSYDMAVLILKKWGVV